MKRFLLLSVSIGLPIASLIWGSISMPDLEVAAQTTGMPTPESIQPESGYTNYSGYYRMRCWPACHTKDIPESMNLELEPGGYTNYSGYYRMRCWPACHTKDIPESMNPEPEPGGYTNYSGYYRMRCWPACHTKDLPDSIKKTY